MMYPCIFSIKANAVGLRTRNRVGRDVRSMFSYIQLLVEAFIDFSVALSDNEIASPFR
jgi:hypothetical protein